MPFISITTSRELTAAQCEKIKSELGFLITTIPNKNERGLMVDICGGHTMYFGGESGDFAYVSVCLYGASVNSAKAEFAGAVAEMLEREAGVPVSGIYLTFSEFPNWFARGDFL